MKLQQSQKKPINWLDEIKSAQDPVALSNLYIKNLKEELRVLESQNKTLKTRLGTYDFEAKKKPQTATEKLATSQQKHIELGQKASDFAKYPTNQKLSNLFVDETAFGSSAVRIEYIRELEFLVDALKKQNADLQVLVQKPIQKTRPIVVPKKYEGHDCVDDEILIGKSTLVNVSKVRCEPYQQKLKPDNTLKDRQIQNLLEEKKLLEQEISMYKETEKTRKSKMEGHDLEKIMKKNDKNTIIYQAKQKYIKRSQQEEELKEKYLQALLQETFLLQQQLQRIQEESQHFDPHK